MFYWPLIQEYNYYIEQKHFTYSQFLHVMFVIFFSLVLYFLVAMLATSCFVEFGGPN